MISTFPNIKIGLMVGIGIGVPVKGIGTGGYQVNPQSVTISQDSYK
jgi:hypothetical protein